VFKARVDGSKKVARNFEQIAQIARAMHTALCRSDWNETARLLREEWKLRRSNYRGISTPLIDRLMAVAARHGGRAAKVCGAGGGGCVLFMVHENARERVAEALGANRAHLLPFRVAREGLVVTTAALPAAGGRM
jgi:D-glycero-alpha-D-manno-heptose-7-phosphate kinase